MCVPKAGDRTEVTIVVWFQIFRSPSVLRCDESYVDEAVRGMASGGGPARLAINRLAFKGAVKALLISDGLRS